MKIGVALSGGLDSLACLVMLKEQEYDLLPLHALFYPHQDRHLVQSLREICTSLGTSLHVKDLQHEFATQVINPFVRDYLHGLTPNPCARCNRSIKFGLLLDLAMELGASALATGHYARKISLGLSGPILMRARDLGKDQSYFLSLVPAAGLARAVFPMQDQYKSLMKKFLENRNITPPAREESNEVCFIPGDYRDFIAGRLKNGPCTRPGPIVDSSGNILGRHQGLWRYTLGQRRGLGIACRHPLYVLRKELSSGTLVVGPREELGVQGFEAGQINILEHPEQWPDLVLVQTRYRQKARPAEVEIQRGRMYVRFKDRPGLPVPGQVAVVYSLQGQVLAGGIIK
ncbi:tRNA 2-thiouridine(34) synthase MnmA [Desulfonatronospira sp.]|uniref:tRNA 2-thiouridine(34) synthase MnmA n=1 Tax=Desulfonatronospira sp. TaxID=1962951 RepID=UPI0025C6D473|nr:tRNA 2-thiouridine(34) synthase MnmA [Desulfonatronospira sp.]